MSEDYFDGPVAEGYDAEVAVWFDPGVIEPTVSFLADLAERAGPGDVLELGIGTGRIALPLRQRGLRVKGIELSPAMVAQLKAKPGAEAIDVTIGDFATAKVPGSFSLAYLVFNTIGNLTTQDQQVACFENAAEHLASGGCFVAEVMVPDLRRLPPGETIRPFEVGPTRLGFDEYDVAAEGLISHHYMMVDGRMETYLMPFRYVWPSELDLMARLAGMTLKERWGDWHRHPFTSESLTHVSVWEKPGSA